MLRRRRILQVGAGVAMGFPAWSGSAQMSNKTQLERDLRRWDAIPLHRTATPGDHATAEWLLDEIKSAGLVGELDEFEFRQRVPGVAQVSDGQHSVRGLPMFDGASTGASGVTGYSGVVPQHALIGITHFSPNASAPITQALHDARASGPYQALVAIADTQPGVPGLAVVNAESYTQPFGPPVLQVPTSAGQWLEPAAAEGRRLTVHAQFSERVTLASNVQTQVVGRQPELAPLVIMTPRSGWWTCTSERGGGISIWLQAMRYFAQNQPLRSVIFTANTGHELSHVGLDHYLHEHPGLVAEAHAWVHLGANFAARHGRVVWQASNQRYLKQGAAALAERGFTDVIMVPAGNRPLGEARNIFDGGGNYISLLGSNPLFHHPDDRWPDAVDLHKATKLSEMMLDMVRELANAPG
jgi:hypothetical protein